jgi:hypothetical protein
MIARTANAVTEAKENGRGKNPGHFNAGLDPAIPF